MSVTQPPACNLDHGSAVGDLSAVGAAEERDHVEAGAQTTRRRFLSLPELGRRDGEERNFGRA